MRYAFFIGYAVFVVAILCSCENTQVGDFKHQSLLKDIAYENNNGVIRYVSSTSPAVTHGIDALLEASKFKAGTALGGRALGTAESISEDILP